MLPVSEVFSKLIVNGNLSVRLFNFIIYIFDVYNVNKIMNMTLENIIFRA